MDAYRSTLAAHLKGAVRQDDLAAAIGLRQASISRYLTGTRFPDAATARKIEVATNGAVPFSLWEEAALSRLGISTIDGDAGKVAA